MKPHRISNPFLRTAAVGITSVCVLTVAAHSSSAATIQKANNANNLNLTTSWSGAVVPTAADIASWNSTVAGANSTVLGADLSWKGISIANPGGLVTIGAGNTLTLGTSGIDMSAATQNLTIGAGLTLGQGGQTWNVPTGRVLTLSGALTRSGGAVLQVTGEGTVTGSPTLVNGIVGPWALVTKPGTSGGALPDGDTYATVNAGNIAPFTGATQNTLTTAWGGMPSGGTGVENHDITTAATYGTSGLLRTANTIRYTGAGAARQNSNSTSAGGVTILNLNGFMNAGSGTFTIGGDPGAAAPLAANGRLNVQIGANKELVLLPMTGDIVFNGVLLDNAGAPVASGVTVFGNNKVVLNGNSTYTGPTVIAGGTLQVASPVATFGSINTTSGITINGLTAKYLHTSTVASTRAITVTEGTLDGTGTLGAVTVANNSGAIVTHGNGGTGAVTLGSLTFNGAGTINANFAGVTPPIAVTGALATTPANGQVILNVASTPLANGSYNLISYGSFGGAASNFTVNVTSGLSSRQSATPVLSGNNVAIQVSGDSPKWTGALNNRWTTAVLSAPKNWRLITAGTTTDFITNDNVLFDDSATGTTSVNISDADIAVGTIEFNNSTKNYTLGSTAGNSITSGSLTKNGTGSLTIELTNNSYSGTTTFNGGTLNLNHGGAIGTGAVTIGTGSAKTLNNTSGSAVTLLNNNAQTWNDDFTFTGSNDLDMGSGAVTVGGAGTDRTVTISAGTLTVGELKAAAHGLVKQGAGTLVLTSTGAGAAASTLSGTLDVAAGTLQINRTGNTGANSGDLVATGIAGTGTITNGAGDDRWLFINTTVANTFNGTLANGDVGGLGFDKQGIGSVTLAGTLSYTGQTTVDAGTLTISVPNSGAGTNTVVNSGTLVMGHPSALGTATTIRLAGNAVSTLDIATDGADNVYGLVFASGVNSTIVSNRATAGDGINHTLSVLGTNGVGGGTLTVTSGPNVTSGTGRITFNTFGMSAGTLQTTVLNPTTANVTLGDVSKVANTLAQTLELGGTSSDNLITGVISDGTAAVALTKSNSSTWTLSSPNTYTGGTAIGTANGAGVLRVTASGALGTGTVVFDASGGNPGPTSRLELSNDITLSNAMTLSQRNNTTPHIVSVSGNNTLSGVLTLAAGGTQALIQSDAGLLTLSGDITTNSANARVLHLGGAGNGVGTGVISNNPVNPLGTVGLVKEGTGTWTLSGVNTTTGAVAVNEGTLALTGDSPTATGAVTVATGATLGGNGDLGGSVTIGAGAHHSLAVGANPGAQVVRTVAALDLTALGDILDLTAAAAPIAGSYILVTATGTITGHTGGTLDDTVVNPIGFSGTVSVVGNDLVLTVSAGGSAYATWAASKGLTGSNNGFTQDNGDFDGVTNALEFVLGGNPKASDPLILPDPSQDATNFYFDFNRADESEAEVGLTFQHGSTLTGWTDIPVTAAHLVNENGGAPDTMRVTVLKSLAVGGKLFGRLRAVK